MKVAIVTVSFPPDNKIAPFPASYELAKALTRAGHEVLVLTMTEGDTRREVHEGIQVHRQNIDMKSFTGLQFNVAMAFPNCLPQCLELFQSTRHILAEFQPDVIESQEFNGLGLLFGLERRYPFVVRVYGPLAHLLRSGTIGVFSPVDIELVHSLEIGSVGLADALITLCHDMANRMGGWAGIAPDQFTVLPTPIAPVPENEPHREPSDNTTYPRLMYWGRIQRQKGVDLLIESLPKIAAEYPNFRLVISGQETVDAGSEEPYANVARARLRELGLERNIEFAGFLSVDEIRQRIVDTDICVFPSRYETACYAAIEAAMYGGCVLATKVGGLPDHISHGVSGYLVEPESSDALADGVIHLARNEELCQQLRAGARKDVIDRCDPDRNAARSIEVYEKAIKTFNERKTAANPTLVKVAEALITGIKSTNHEDRVYKLLCDKYSEGAKAGFEQGLAEGLKAASEQNGHGRRSLVRRIAGKVMRMTKGAST